MCPSGATCLSADLFQWDSTMKIQLRRLSSNVFLIKNTILSWRKQVNFQWDDDEKVRFLSVLLQFFGFCMIAPLVSSNLSYYCSISSSLILIFGIQKLLYCVVFQRKCSWRVSNSHSTCGTRLVLLLLQIRWITAFSDFRDLF
jgi:hypothetical protein